MNLTTLPKIGDRVKLTRRDGRVHTGRLHRVGVDSIVLDVSVRSMKVRDGREPHLLRIARSHVLSVVANNPDRGFTE